MTKEMFVSSTPHETKVAVTENDQLAEIYYERENEYTLAGSIYKGRVTRVLPGMQSAFVDIGLERDAFLYVSDFMELEEDDEEFESIPVPRQVQSMRSPEPAQEMTGGTAEASQETQVEGEEEDGQEPEPAEEASGEAQPGNQQNGDQRDQGRPWRGRRRRRGQRGRSFPDSKFTRPEGRPEGRPENREERPAEKPAEEQPREFRGDRDRGRDNRDFGRDRNRDFGPPPGYQPIILPGESISKYQRQQPQQAAPPEQVRETAAQPMAAPAGHDFAEESHSAPEQHFEQQHHVGIAAAETHAEAPRESKDEARPEHEQEHRHHDEEERRFESMNVAAVFGGETAEQEATPESEHHGEYQHESGGETPAAESAAAPEIAQFAPGAGHVEEEEIEEEEADLSHFQEEADDARYEELEEETLEPAYEARQEDAERASQQQEAEAAALGEEEEEFEENGELAEAEAGEGEETAARAEMRGPSGTAGFQQRTSERPAFDPRRGGNRGRRGGGRSRFRPRRDFQRSQPLISDLLKEGQEVLIQIAKEPIGKKGARITSHIALPGRFLVYMPTVNHTGVSRKIASDEERQRLKRIVNSERENGHGGFIVRTAAENINEDELRADIRFLKNLWNEIKGRAESSKAPALIYHDLNLVERVLRDQVTEDFAEIWVDTQEEYERVVRFASRFQPNLVRRIKLYTKERPLYEQFNIQEEINKALKSKVWLKSGGYIVINQTEALVAIDVNTGKYVGKTQRLEDTIVKTNVDAINEIVRQIRLRDLGGIIIIDFIDMDERRNRQRVMQALEEALRSDRAPSKVLQFNDFGLVAITRKRVKQSLERTLGAPCSYCTGTGFVKSVTTVVNELWVELKKIYRHLEPGDIEIRVNPEVAKALKANAGRAIQEMEELTGRTILVRSDASVHQEQFDIV